MMRLRSGHILLSSASGVAVLLASPASAGVKAGVDVSVAGRVASNPFNEQSPGSAVVSVSPSAEPWLTYEDPDTTLGLRGNVVADRYSSKYGSTETALITANGSQAMSPRLNLTGNVGYNNTNNATNSFLLQPAPTTTTPTIPGLPLPDLTVAGFRVRTQSLNGRVGAGLQLSEYDSLSINATGNMTRTNLTGTSDFNTYGGGFSYSRKLSSRTSLSLMMQASKVDYLRTVQGDGTIYSPMVGFSYQAGSRINMHVNLGASISNSKTITGASLTSTALAGDALLCNRFGHGGLCLAVSRAAQPNALGGIGVSTAASISYDRTVGQFGSMTASIRYGRSDQGALAGNFAQDVLGGQVSYYHRFSRRFTAFVTPSYSKVFDHAFPRGSDIEVRAGVTYRFGAIQ